MNELQAPNQMSQIMVRRPAGPLRPGGSGAPAQGGITGRDIMRIIRKRKWMIIIPTVLFMIISVVSTALWLKYAPKYSASALVAVTPTAGGAMDVGRSMYSMQVNERHVKTYAQMVKSESILRRAIERPEIKRTMWFKKSPQTAILRLKDTVIVAPLLDTNLIRIEVSAKESNDIADLATAVANAFVDDTADTANESRVSVMKTVEGKIRDQEAQSDALKKERERLLGVVTTADFRENVRKLGEYSGRLTELMTYAAQIQAAKATLEKQAASGELENSPEVIKALDSDGRLNSLRSSEMGLLIERDDALRQYGPEHRRAKTIESRLASIRKAVEERKNTLVAFQVKSLLENSKAQEAAIIAQQMQIQAEYDKISSEVKDAETTMEKMKDLEAREAALTKNLRALQTRYDDFVMATQDERPVRLQARAETPEEPSFPKWSIMIPAGVMLGLVIGFGFAFLLEFIDTSIKSPADIARRIDLPVLGMVPHLRDIDEDIEEIRTAVLNDSSPLVSESFRRIRTCLNFSASVEHRRSILITSPLPEEGRTSVTLNLAASIARDGRKVLVLDTNFRQPMTSKLLTEASATSKGLSNVLTGQSTWQDVIHEVEANLHVIPAGPMPPNPTELLGSNQMSKTLDDMLNQYDQVLLDGAPYLVVTDAQVLSSIVDGVILVVRAGASTHGVVQRTKSALNRVGAKILGVVLSAMRVTVGGYLRENYDTFYEYQEKNILAATSEKTQEQTG